jgi:Skp family chaperone for outer membrane proteins
MKTHRFLAAFAFMALIPVSSGLAQPKPVPTTTQPSASLAGASVPDSKIALIFSADFQNPKTGIARFGALMTTLNREFEQPEKELQQLQQRITQLQDEITKLQQAPAPDIRVTQQKMDQLERLKTEYKRKQEDGQAAYNKRRDELFGPLQDDIGKALEVYARAHNINVLIDGSQVPVVYFADSIDITRAFIAEYNSKNPATAAVTTPR